MKVRRNNKGRSCRTALDYLEHLVSFQLKLITLIQSFNIHQDLSAGSEIYPVGPAIF